jgi:phosphoribosylformylglycinamidine cyclo-ligase
VAKKLIDVLLEPTKIYVKTYKETKNSIKALAHITGGGITENLPRVLPDNLTAFVDKKSIKSLEIFNYMRDYVAEDELYRTFNMGVGMVLVCDKIKADEVCAKSGGYVIGELKNGDKKVELV